MNLLHVTVLCAAAASLPAQHFEKPFRLMAGGKPIEVDVGHA